MRSSEIQGEREKRTNGEENKRRQVSMAVLEDKREHATVKAAIQKDSLKRSQSW